MHRSLLAAILMTVFCTQAFADLLPPDSESCQQKSAGDACKTDDGKDGSCVLVKDGYCHYHPGHGEDCHDTLKCLTEASGALPINASEVELDDNAEAQGCNTNSNMVSYASFGLGALMLLMVRRVAKKRA